MINGSNRPDKFTRAFVVTGPLLKLSVTGLSDTGSIDAAGGADSPVSPGCVVKLGLIEALRTTGF